MDSPRDPAPPVITGVGTLAAPSYALAFESGHPPAGESAPELTGFETPEGAPAFGFELPDFRLEDHLPHYQTFVDRTSALALAAARLALRDAGLDDVRDGFAPRRVDPASPARALRDEIGCAFATEYGCLEAMEIFWKKVKSGNPKFAPPLAFTHGYANSPSSLLCIEYGLRGSAATFSGSRTAGLEALWFALQHLRRGSARAVLVGASEGLTRPLHALLHARGVLSASGRAGVWSDANDGLVPGEGAAFVVLETAASAAARGRAPLAELTTVELFGPGESGDEQLRAGELAARPAPLLFAQSPAEPALEGRERAFWARHAPPDAAVAGPKLLTGDLFSASPLLAVALGAELLAGRRALASLPRRAPPHGVAAPARPQVVALRADDPRGPWGVAVLRAVRKGRAEDT